MSKFGRNYELVVQTNGKDALVDQTQLIKDGLIVGNSLIVKPPFSMEFDVTRNIFSSASTASFRVYNLSETNRNSILKNQFDSDVFKAIALKAGYGTQNPIIFAGDVNQCWSVREGVNFITQIECFDGGYAFANNVFGDSFPDGTQYEDILATLLDSLQSSGITTGAIGSFPGKLTRGNSYSGNTTALLTELSGGSFFIDNGVAHCLNDNEILPGDIRLINAASGLLGTPVRELEYLNLEMMFEPNLIIGQGVELQSVVNGVGFNSFCKVISLKHRGIISEAVCGDAITSVGLLHGVFKTASLNG